MRYFKRLTAILLMTALLLSSCTGADTSWAFKSGNTQVTSGLYILYEISAFSEAEQKVVEGTENYTGMKTSELLKQQVEGKTASDWIKEKSAADAKKYIAVQEKFEAMELELNEADLASIDNILGSIKESSGDFYTKNGVAESTLKDFYTGYMRSDRLFEKLYGVGGEFAVGDEEKKSHFTGNYAMIDVLLMYKPFSVPEGETKTLEQLTADTKTQAEAYLERLKNGEEIEQLSYEWQLSQVSDEEKEGVTKPEKGYLSMVVSEANRASYGDALTDASLGAKAGESTLVEDDSFFVVFKKSDIMENAEVFESYQSAVLREMKSEEYEALVVEWVNALQVETNQDTLRKYKPEIIKFDEV